MSWTTCKISISIILICKYVLYPRSNLLKTRAKAKPDLRAERMTCQPISKQSILYNGANSRTDPTTQLVLPGAHPSTMSSYILNPNLLLLCQHKYVVTSVNLIEKNESYCWLQVEQTAMISWVILLLLMMASALTVKKSYRWEINSRSQTEVLWCRAFMENACGKSCLALNETSCPAPSHMSNLWNPTDENASKRMKYQNGKVIFGK